MQQSDSGRHLTVVQVLPALASGGVERGTLEVGNYLVEHGHRSIVISGGGRMVEQLLREGSEHVTWDVGRKSLLTLWRYVFRLRRFLRDEKVDILHLRSRMPAWVGYLAWKGMDPNTRPRLITTVHGLYSVNAYSAVMVKGEKVIAVSETVRDYIINNYPSVLPSNIEVIFRGVDPKVFPHGYRPPEKWLQQWWADYPQLMGKKILLLPGRITRLKGHEDFILLIKKLKESDATVHGLIVGGAEEKKLAYLAELRQRVQAANLQNEVTFTGQRNDLREIMAISNMVFSLSTQPESFGRTVLEALSLGVPVIGYDHGGVGEILVSLYYDGLVHSNDLEQVVKLASRLTENRQQIPPVTRFTLAMMLHSTLNLYHKISAHTR